MRARPMARELRGPLLLPARLLFLIGGLLSIALAAFNLFHEFHASQVDRLYAIIALAVGVVWLAALIVGFVGWRVGIVVAALIAFTEFGVIVSSHFESTAGALSTFVSKEGLPLATVDMALVPACMLVVFSAGVCWTNPRGRNRRYEMLPLLLAALIGSILVILQATDDLHRSDFGSANPEDGALAAAILASLWLAGGLWISRIRRSGALLIAIATFGVWYSFVTIHLLKGGTNVSDIAAKSGLGWAIVAAAAAILAAASFLVALLILVRSVIRRGRKDAAATEPLRRRA